MNPQGPELSYLGYIIMKVLYQSGFNYAPAVKYGPALGVTS